MSKERVTYISAFVPGNDYEPEHSIQIVQALNFDSAILFYHSNEKLFNRSYESERLHQELAETLELLMAHKHPRISRLRALILQMRIRIQNWI